MNTQPIDSSKVIQQGLLPLFYHEDADISLRVIDALYAGGIRAVEYTNRGEAALQNFSFLKKKTAEQYPDLLLGIGTIKTTESAKSFADAGADFFVSPGITLALISFFASTNYTWIPGCMTTSEIMLAEENNIHLVKLFPGNLLQPSFVKAVKELFPAMRFMPTGGVDTSRSNLEEWFASGVGAVGMGSKLITTHLLQQKDYQRLTILTADTLQTIASIKESHAREGNY